MSSAKKEVKTLLEKLPENCTLEDVQHHLYVVNKINTGITRAETEGSLSQAEVERKFERWTMK